MEVGVEKNGKMINGRNGVKVFKSRKTARAFISNLIWVSKTLMPGDFRFIKAIG